MKLLTRRSFLASAAVGPAVVGSLRAAVAPTGLDAESPLIRVPADPTTWPAFREALHEWRAETRIRLRYDDTLYRKAEFDWVRRCFSCCFLMVCDEMFYDTNKGRYRVAGVVEEGRREFGGYDAVVLWHAYPRIGVDDRNQFDFYRDLPGGVLGVRDMVREFRAHGVRVFIDYNPWDTGTRREPRNDLEVLATLVQALEVDGIFLDTMDRGAEAFRSRLDAARPGVVLEGEIALPVERVFDHHLSWAQWFQDGPVPGVLRNKWLERRHLQHQIRRWDLDHTAELHTAWMNGSGMLVWENVFGSWVGWNPRDRSILRSMLAIQRRFVDLFCGEGWTPWVPTLAQDVYASLWETPGVRLWTVVNRSDRALRAAELLSIETQKGERHDDLILGGAATLDIRGKQSAVWVGHLPPRGLGCLLAGREEALGEGYPAFLEGQKAVAARADWDLTTAPRPTVLRLAKVSDRRRRAPPGMLAVPEAELILHTELRVRECGFYESVPARGHTLGASYDYRLEAFSRPVKLRAFAIDSTPVTNAQFAEFVRRARYQPRHRENFLKHWGHGHAPFGQEDHPVVYVSLEDARAYATWRGKRLPTEEEWQYAAQGSEGRKYPWGDAFVPGRCNDGSRGLTTTAVTAFPEGRSPFGVYDLCGNVWEWTESERSDGRTRFCMLKGGSYYRAKGSGWYFDGGPQTNAYSAKFLLMWPGLDRCATVGFRCVVDLRG